MSLAAPRYEQTASLWQDVVTFSRLYTHRCTNTYPQIHTQTHSYIHTHTFTDAHTFSHLHRHRLSQIHRYPPTYPHAYTHSSSQARYGSTGIHKNTLIFRVRFPPHTHRCTCSSQIHIHSPIVTHNTSTPVVNMTATFMTAICCAHRYTCLHTDTDNYSVLTQNHTCS